MTIKEEILHTVEILVNGKLGNISKNRYIPTVVTGISGGKYKVNIDNGEYFVKNGVGLTDLKTGSLVLVHVYDGNLSNGYICAKL